MIKDELTKPLEPLLIYKLYLAIRNGTFQPMYKWPDSKLIRTNMRYYKHWMGYAFDLRNPKTFTEKIQWYKFFYGNPMCPYIVDKLTFKQYIEEKLGSGYTIPVYCVWNNAEDFESQCFDAIPAGVKEFCLKANLQSNGRCIKIIHDKDKVDIDSLKKEVAQWFKIENTLINSVDRFFYNSKPLVFAEKNMSNIAGQLYDYKFFCFGGEPYCIYAAIDQFENGVNTDAYPIIFYDLNWNKMEIQYGHHPNNADVHKPIHYDEMLEISKKLSRDFPFVRVDFFDTEEKLYVAELTFNPGGGFVPFYPESFNQELGDLFILPS